MMFSDILSCDIDRMNSLKRKIKEMKINKNQFDVQTLLKELTSLKKNIELRARFLIERDLCKQKIRKFQETVILRDEAVENYHRNLETLDKNKLKKDIDKYQNYLDLIILEVATKNKLFYIQKSINNYEI